MKATGTMNHAPEVADFEYPSAETLECPFPFYKALREQAPVHQLPSGDYLVTRWDDIVAVARKPSLFSSHIGPFNPGLSGDLGLDEDESGRFTPWQMPFSDPPEHKQKRSLGKMLIMPERLRSFEPLIHRHVDALIDTFCERGEADFVAAFADILPTLVVNEIFGLERPKHPPATEHDACPEIANTGVGMRLASGAEKRRVKAFAVERGRYYREQILARVNNPTDDFTTAFVQAKLARDGDLDLAYLTVELMNFHSAGVDTTAHMLASTLQLLLENSPELELLRSDPSRAGLAIDEALRLEAPVQWLQRIALQDTEIAGVLIPKHASVLLVWGSGNRDGCKFEKPDEFWPDRPGGVGDRIGGVLAFGFGVHSCLGAPLARLEGKIALARLLERLPGLRLSAKNDFRHILDANHRAPIAVHIEFQPTPRLG